MEHNPENLKTFLKLINGKITKDNPDNVIGSVVNFPPYGPIQQLTPDLLLKDPILTIDFRKYNPAKSFASPNFKVIRNFFNRYEETIKSYMWLYKEELVFYSIFQDEKHYKLVLVKMFSEIEIYDGNDVLLNIIKF